MRAGSCACAGTGADGGGRVVVVMCVCRLGLGRSLPHLPHPPLHVPYCNGLMGLICPFLCCGWCERAREAGWQQGPGSDGRKAINEDRRQSLAPAITCWGVLWLRTACCLLPAACACGEVHDTTPSCAIAHGFPSCHATSLPGALSLEILEAAPNRRLGRASPPRIPTGPAQVAHLDDAPRLVALLALVSGLSASRIASWAMASTVSNVSPGVAVSQRGIRREPGKRRPLLLACYRQSMAQQDRGAWSHGAMEPSIV